MDVHWKSLSTFAVACLVLNGCSDAAPPKSTKPENQPVTAPAPEPTPTPVAVEQKQPEAKIGVYEAIMLNPETSQPQPLHLELKPENKFTAYPANEANNKLHGEWKTEGPLLICTGNTELTKQTMILKIDASSLDLISITQKDTDIPLSQIMHIGAKSITFKKKP